MSEGDQNNPIKCKECGTEYPTDEEDDYVHHYQSKLGHCKLCGRHWCGVCMDDPNYWRYCNDCMNSIDDYVKANKEEAKKVFCISE